MVVGWPRSTLRDRELFSEAEAVKRKQQEDSVRREERIRKPGEEAEEDASLYALFGSIGFSIISNDWITAAMSLVQQT